VTVVQAAVSDGELTRDRVDYRFVACKRPGNIRRRLMTFWQERSIGKEVAAAQPDVIHFHGLALSGCLISVRQAAPDTPILAQDHAGRFLRFWERPLAKRALRAVNGVMFTSRSLAEPWLQHGILPRSVPVFEVCESSSTFTPGDRAAARAATGLYGDPCLLWVGRLNKNKDPLTVLDALSRAASELPRLQWWCFYTEAPLLDDVRARIAADPTLAARVHLMGSVSHERVEPLCRSADFFLAGSHDEGSGYALIEALACGVTPIVTDIPAFRAITGEGAVGALVPLEDSEAMARSLVELAALDPAELRRKTLSHFERFLSFDVLGERLRDVYEVVAGQR
jgi:glycosyltransferase involved in cell wall biosynthesis